VKPLAPVQAELPGASKLRRSIRQLVIVLGLAATAYAVSLAFFSDASPRATLRQLVSWAGLQAAALCLASYVLRGMRWRAWMAQYGRPLGLAEGLRLYLAGYAFTPTPGNVGEAVRGLWLARKPLSAGQSLAIFGAERLADLACLLLMALPVAAWWSWRWGLASAYASWLVPGVLALVALLVACAWGLARLARPHRWLRQAWLHEAWTCLCNKPHRWLLLTLSAWLLQGLAVWLVCHDSGLTISAWRAAGLYAMAMIGGALSALPAGLGGTEAILTGLLIGHGTTAGSAFTITVVVRLLTLWFAVGLGVLALAWSLVVRKDIKLG
jgi:uncharacterized membrane protein YbhN (UPF0104 family)